MSIEETEQFMHKIIETKQNKNILKDIASSELTKCYWELCFRL